jgi:hypothetical protein
MPPPKPSVPPPAPTSSPGWLSACRTCSRMRAISGVTRPAI